MIQKSAGLLIIKNNKILLLHPTGADENIYSIPKGHIEKNETTIEAAIRETYEEAGIIINDYDINKTEHIIEYRNKHGKLYKNVYYFIVHIPDELYPDKLDINQLQKEEVDIGKFFTKEEASEKIFWRFKEMLNYID